jgi:hypothetical protein
MNHTPRTQPSRAVRKALMSVMSPRFSSRGEDRLAP